VCQKKSLKNDLILARGREMMRLKYTYGVRLVSSDQSPEAERCDGKSG
jgi:hypothetical protein